MVCFKREIEKLVADGLIKVDHSEYPNDSWIVAKVDSKFVGVKLPGVEGLRDTDDRSKAVQKTPWRVSLDSMKRRVKSVEYIFPPSIPHMTIAVVMLDNGYALVGESAPADPENFNEKLGKEYAYENAMKKLWPLEAYVMRDYLSDAVEIRDPSERWGA